MGWGRGNSGTSSLRSLSAGIGTAVLQSCDRVVLWTHILSYENPNLRVVEGGWFFQAQNLPTHTLPTRAQVKLVMRKHLVAIPYTILHV